MLDHFLQAAYEQDFTKTAERQLVDKLKTLPTERLLELANDEKLGSFGCTPMAMGGTPDPKTWLDMFKGTPLFDKALELERADLQLEQQDIQRRMEDQAQDTWTKRDALRLQKRMLELDLAMEGAGGAEEAPEQAEEQGVQLLEQAQAEERAQGEGGEPHEQKEDAAIQQFRKAQSEEAAAKAKKPPAPAAQEAPAQQPAPAAKTTEVKVATALAVGRLLAKIAEPAPPKGTSVVEWDKILQGKKTAAEVPLPALLGGAMGAHKAVGAGGGPLSGAALGAIGAQGGSEIGGDVGRVGGHMLAKKLHLDPVAARNIGALAGSVGGGVLGFRGMTSHYNKKEEGEKGKKKHAGILGSALTAGKAALPQLGAAATGAKNLVGTAYKSGGLGQVAKSVGNVAGGFAKANPMAAAGIAAGAAGGAGLLAGRLSKSNQPRV